MSHSLYAAVADGTISAEAAFCGLAQEDVARLAERHPGALLLVRLRDITTGDKREIMSAQELIDWRNAPTPRRVNQGWWYFENIRAVEAISNRSS